MGVTANYSLFTVTAAVINVTIDLIRCGFCSFPCLMELTIIRFHNVCIDDEVKASKPPFTMQPKSQ